MFGDYHRHLWSSVERTDAPAIAETTLWTPDPLSVPQLVDHVVTLPKAPQADGGCPIRPITLLEPAFAETSLPGIELPLIVWTHEIASGEILDVVLADAGIPAPARAEIALALGVEYDPRRLRPWHAVAVISKAEGNPRRVELAVDDGVQIETILGRDLVIGVLGPDPEMVIFASEAVIESSALDTLDKASPPARFSGDLARMLGGTRIFEANSPAASCCGSFGTRRKTGTLHRPSRWVWSGGWDGAWLRRAYKPCPSLRGAGRSRTRAARDGRPCDRSR